MGLTYVPGRGFIEESSISNELLIAAGVVGGTALVGAGLYYYYSSSEQLTKSAVKTSVPGLHNLGNTCYANALLQGLSSLPSMPRWLEAIDTNQPNLNGGFVSELKDIILKLNQTSDCAYNAGGIVSSLAVHGWNITLGVEQDLYELLNVFVTTWDEELVPARKRLAEPSLLDICGTESRTLPELLSPTVLKRLVFDRCIETVRLDAAIRAPCFGLTATQLKCCQTSCGFNKVRYDPFGVISVSIPKNSYGNNVTIESLLRKYFCMEVIREASCDKCKKLTGRTGSGLFKKQGFSKLPQCLIIRVERVGMLPSGVVFKLSDHVQFGETLDVRDFCFYRNKEQEYDRMMRLRKEEARSPELTSRIVGGGERITVGGLGRVDTGLAPQLATIDGGSFLAERREMARYRYQLRAVSEHRGVPQTGHFVTYRRGIQDSNQWYLTNDSVVTPVPYAKVAKSQAYMLFYERVQPYRWFKKPSATNFALPSASKISSE